MAIGTKQAESNANIGFEAKLWLAAAKLPSIGRDVDDAIRRLNPAATVKEYL